MSLRTTVAAPFRQRGARRLTESEFVAAVAMERKWYTPDQAKRLIDVAVGEGLLERDGDRLATTFDVTGVAIPEGFEPGEGLLQERSTFEQILETLTAEGMEKREAVAGINRLQSELHVTVEAAAVVYAHRQGVDVDDAAERVRKELLDGNG